MIDRRIVSEQSGPQGLRAIITWLGAGMVLGCGLWMAARHTPLGLGPRAPAAAAEVSQEVGWIDRRLAAAEGPGNSNDAPGECRIAALHWDRVTRLAQVEYYRRPTIANKDGQGQAQDYGAFRRQFLHTDESGDVAATREAAARALALMPAGRGRVRPLWFFSMASSACGQRQEAIGALIEISRYKPAQTWVWRLLAAEFQSRGDWARADLAAEQAWRASTDRPISAYISGVIRDTPYARPAICPAGRLALAKPDVQPIRKL